VPTKGTPNHPVRYPNDRWEEFGRIAGKRGEVRSVILQTFMDRYIETGGEPYIIKKIIRRRKKK